MLWLGDSDVELDLTAAWEASERLFTTVHPLAQMIPDDDESAESEATPAAAPPGWGAEDLHACLHALAADRPVFHHEADFQHALAWRLHLDHPEAHLRLETRPMPGRVIFLDIAARFGERRVAIELKYLARRLDVVFHGEPFALQDRAAQLIRRYDAVKDIARLEDVIAAGAADVGFAVVLSNVAGYWRPGRSTDSAFRLDEGRVLTGSLAWSATAGAGTMRNREDALTLRGSYPLHWTDYSTVTAGPAGAFRYLLIEVGPGLV